MNGEYLESDYGLINNQDDAIKKLVDLLREEQAILMVGAGSSKFVEYPLLDELLEMLRNQFASKLEKPKKDDDYDPAKFAGIIREYANKIEYQKFLESTFKHKNPMFEEFHLSMVGLNFKGIVTTNYDDVLESAIFKLNEQYEYYNSPESINLCDTDKSYRVAEFLRSLSKGANLSRVLHIHGHWKNPEMLILTEEDYIRFYGNINEAGKNLDCLHRKVIWALLTMYSVVFIGFNIKEDPIFRKMLDIVRNDLNLHGECLHYAILPSTDRESAKDLVKYYCVQPIFYNVIKEDGHEDHTDLKRLIFEIEDKVNKVEKAEIEKISEPDEGQKIEGTKSKLVEPEGPKPETIKSPRLSEINKRMLEI